MAGRLSKPGVDVFQILESRKPTAFRPVLVPVIVGTHKNIQYNLPLAFHYASTANSAVAIPTGVSAVVQQKFAQSSDIDVFIGTSRGLAQLTAVTDYTITLDAALGVDNEITTSATINVTKKLVDDSIASSITLETGSTNYIVIEDSSLDFSAAGVQPGDLVSIDYSTSVNNSDPSQTLSVVTVESPIKIKATYADNSAAWVDETLITYDIDTPQLSDVAGQLYVSYDEAVVINDANTIIEIQGAQDIKDNFGTLEPENPIGYHCLMGALATDRTFYAVRTNEDSTAGFEIALDSLKTDFDSYFVIPASQTDDIIALCKTHVDFMSQPEQKGERVTLVCKDIPEYDIIKSGLTCTLSSTTSATSTLGFSGSPDLTAVKPGHIIRANTATIQLVDGTYINDTTEKLVVLENPGGDALKVSGQITNLNGVPIGVSSFTCSATSVSYIGGDKARIASEKAESLDDKRVINIFPDIFEASVTRSSQSAPHYEVVEATAIEEVSGSVAAAAVGCHASSLSPTQPQTNMAVPGLQSAVGSNEELSSDNLDVAAGGGNWILVNSTGGGTVTTRHQLTTAVSDVNTREFSVVKSVDYSAKVIRDYLAPLVGKSVITDSFIKKVVRPTASAALYALTDGGHLSAKSSIIAIYQNEDDPTRITLEFDAVPLYPANNFTVKLYI